MIRNYLIIALRNLLRNKVLSFINITGLSIGLACCLLIFLYTKDELSYDRFHAKGDQLYRITCQIKEKEGDVRKFGIGGQTQAPSFKAAIPEIKEFVRVQERDFTIKRGNETFEDKASWVDNNFFSVFSFPLITGDPKSVLSGMNSIVLTDESAIKYFGTKDAVGKTLELEIGDKFEPFIVSGIARRSPENSSIKFKMLLPFSYLEEHDKDEGWMFLSYPSYLVMDAHVNQQAVAAKMKQVYQTKAKDQIIDEHKHGGDAVFTWGVQPLREVHLDTTVLYTDNGSDPIYSYILSGIAIFILLIACINFINLTVAQSLKRSKEIGIRKVIGGQRKQLMKQFLGESFLLCFIAFLFAIVLAELVLPVFNQLSNKRLSLDYLIDTKLVLCFIGLFLVTGFIAGFYPALVLSGFDPVKTLYNRSRFTGKNYLSKSLVVIQFALATFLIITTIFIYSQFDYITHKELGYNDKNLISVEVGRHRDMKLMGLFKNEFSKLPGAVMVAPRMGGEWGTRSKANGKDIDIRYEHIDEDYLPTLQVPVLSGRNFSTAFPADSTNSVLVNEAFAAAAGWKDPVGKTVDFLNGQDVKLTIVGLVKDYHYASLKEKIGPQLFSVQPWLPFGRFMVRINPVNASRTINDIEKIFHRLVPNHPFNYVYQDQSNIKNYEAELRWKKIITLAAILTIFISCIGLFGLTTLAIQKRTKEIGVRKVLGASVMQVSALVSRNFIALVFIAFLFAIPAAWFAAGKWLENFAYRINMSWWVFALAAVLTVVIALITVSFQSIRAAIANPVKALRSE